MASSTPHTIILKQMEMYGRHQKEALAGTAGILPGDLLKVYTSGNVYPFSLEKASNASPRFAIENPYCENNSSAAIDVAYSSGHTVFYVMAEEGDEIYAWLAAAENVSIGDYLVGAGSAYPGDLAEAGTGAATEAEVEGVVARALEAVNNGSGTAHVRIKVEVVS